MLRRVFVIAVCLTLLGACASAPHDRAAVLFEGACLIAGEGTAPLENAAFIVDGGIVTQIGRGGELALPAGARRVDLTGKTVMHYRRRTDHSTWMFAALMSFAVRSTSLRR